MYMPVEQLWTPGKYFTSLGRYHKPNKVSDEIDGLVQDCSNPSALSISTVTAFLY